MKEPHYPDRCGHLGDGGFVGTTVSPTSGLLVDVYLYHDPAEGVQKVCLRYGAEDHEYSSPYPTAVRWSDPRRTVHSGGKVVLASVFDGPAMELVRAYLGRK